MRVEQLSKLNNGKLQTLKLFCEKANIRILPADISEVEKENMVYLEELQAESECIFDYNTIALIDNRTYKEYLELIYGNRGTLQMRLETEKFSFCKRFVEDADEDILGYIWDEGRHLIYKVRELIFGRECECFGKRDCEHVRDPERHIINRILAENGVWLSKHLRDSNEQDTVRTAQKLKMPNNMTTSIPFDEIKRSFRFDGRIQDYNYGLVARVVNSFFGLGLYDTERVEKSKQKKMIYVVDEDKEYTLDVCLENMLRPVVQPEIFPKADEDSMEIDEPIQNHQYMIAKEDVKPGWVKYCTGCHQYYEHAENVRDCNYCGRSLLGKWMNANV